MTHGLPTTPISSYMRCSAAYISSSVCCIRLMLIASLAESSTTDITSYIFVSINSIYEHRHIQTILTLLKYKIQHRKINIQSKLLKQNRSIIKNKNANKFEQYLNTNLEN